MTTPYFTIDARAGVDAFFADLTSAEQDAVLIQYTRQGNLQGFSYKLADLLEGRIYLSWTNPGIPSDAAKQAALRKTLMRGRSCSS